MGKAMLGAALVLVVSSLGLVAREGRVSRVVSGAVLDASENGIVGASMVLTDLQTGKQSATYTQQGGRYQFSGLQASHDYTIQASYKGQSSEVRKVSFFDTRSNIVINLRIPPPKE